MINGFLSSRLYDNRMKRFYAIVILILCTLGLTPSAWAASALNCPTTPQIATSFPPKEALGTTSNLARRTGSAVFAKGQLIYIEGKITDSGCVPVQNAVVSIWQANSMGDMVYGKDIATSSDKDFLYTGRATTNNAGEFTFLTVMPGSRTGETPFISLRVNHSKLEGLETKIFFPDNNNRSDADFLELMDQDRPLVTAIAAPNNQPGQPVIYYMPLALKGSAPYRRF